MGIRDKIKEQMTKVRQAAILEMLRDAPGTSIGEILVEVKDDGDLYDAFCKLSIDDIVDHIAGTLIVDDEEEDEEEVEEEEGEPEEAEEDEEEVEEVEEEGEEEPEVEEAEEEPEPEPEPVKASPKSKKKKTKKRAPPKTAGKKKTSKKKDVADDSGYNLRTEEGRGQYDSALVTALRKLDDKASMNDVRKIVGGTPAQVRAALNRLIEVGRVDYEGQTRSTRYFLAKAS